MTSSRCVVVVVVVALFVSLRVSLLTQGRKGEGRSFCCFCEVLCHFYKCFAKKSEEVQDKRSRPASLSLEEEKPKKKKREEHRRLRKSSE